MIAADTSSISAYFEGDSGADVVRVDTALANGLLRLPPVVLTELLSDPGPSSVLGPILTQFKLLEITEGYWQRAGKVRQRLISLGLRAKIADALIAQSCIDHDLPLITRDVDFRHFAKHCGLKLA
jgi:predicted nucleic acid-binding protein